MTDRLTLLLRQSMHVRPEPWLDALVTERALAVMRSAPPPARATDPASAPVPTAAPMAIRHPVRRPRHARAALRAWMWLVSWYRSRPGPGKPAPA